jgi:hypothetical protein
MDSANFLIRQYNLDIHKHAHSPYEYMYKPYLYEHFRELSRQILKIDEVITDILLSMET